MSAAPCQRDTCRVHGRCRGHVGDWHRPCPRRTCRSADWAREADPSRGDPGRVGRARRDAAVGAGARAARARPRPEPARRRAAAAADPALPARGGRVRRLARRAAPLHAAAAGDRRGDRAPTSSGSRRPTPSTRGDPSRWRRARRALGLQRGQRPDRAAQPLVPDRGAARDGPALARLRQGRRPRLPARAARRRLDPRASSPPEPPALADCRRPWPSTTTTTITSTTTITTTSTTTTTTTTTSMTTTTSTTRS